MNTSTMIKCEHDWVDGGCTANAPEGAPGWERRRGADGSSFWLCPDSIAQLAGLNLPTTDQIRQIVLRAGWFTAEEFDRWYAYVTHPESDVSECDARREDEHGVALRCILSAEHDRGHVWQRAPGPDASEQ